MKKISDGWHRILGHNVDVKDGCVMHCTKLDRNGCEVYAAPYRWSRRFSCWINESGMSVEAFRAGIKRETVGVM